MFTKYIPDELIRILIHTAPIKYSIHEQDRAIIRENIVEAIVLTPQVVRAQLAQCVNHIIKYDFPGRWTQIVDKINIYFQNPGT